MDRRTFLSLTGSAIGLVGSGATAIAAGQSIGRGNSEDWRRRFVALPGDKSFLIGMDARPTSRWASYCPHAPLFVGSALKTFILAKYLQKVEAGSLSEDELLPINDDIRSLSSSVFGANPDAADNLAGKASARTVLEAMISHSDNTATDAALLRVGIGDVRDFIAAAGLSETRIPDSTRIMFSYLAGAECGTDKGWSGMLDILAGQDFGPPNSPVNDCEAFISTASELVSYYQRALAGEFFTKPETLTEFKRIQAMADLIPRVAPADTAAYAKGGSIDWQDFHALCAPGQMVVKSRRPVTFCFTVNWTGPDEDVPGVTAEFATSVAGMLAMVAELPR